MVFDKLGVIEACDLEIANIIKEQLRLKTEACQTIINYNEQLKTKNYWQRMWYSYSEAYENLTIEDIMVDFDKFAKWGDDWYCSDDAPHIMYKRNTIKKLRNILVLTRIDENATIDLDRTDSILVQKVIEGIA